MTIATPPTSSAAHSTATPAPSHWRAIAYSRRARRRPRNLDALWLRAQAGLVRVTRRPGGYLAHARRIVALKRNFVDLPDDRLAEIASDMRALFRTRRDRPGDLDRALALARELAFRRVAMRPFEVQLGGALALLDGCVAELATGEGKTLVAALAAAVQAWRGQGCHVVTANDYLAQRDAAWMRPLYESLGLKVGAITQDTPADERAAAYDADVTYTTSKEVAADFLRDRLALSPHANLTESLARRLAAPDDAGATPLLLRGLPFAIVDEADSVLIDDAVTPLILNGPASNPVQAEAYAQAVDIADRLDPRADYRVDRRHRDADLTDAGRDHVAALTRDLHGLWQAPRRREELIVQAIAARELFMRDEHYIVLDGRVVVIDESTGRTLPDRTWRAGLHQAIEARECLEIQPMRETIARISFQRFFNMYERLAGMTGTAREAGAEFWTTYRMPIVVFPTNKPARRRVLAPIIARTARDKWRRVVEEIRREHERGRPVLVGTPTIGESEHLSELLEEVNLPHGVLNARRNAEEAEIIAQAGRPARITVATNMAGRGTDIVLAPGVAELGGLHVVATSFHDSARVDRQLLGRAARQGDPGSGRIIASLEDALLAREAPRLRRLADLLPGSLLATLFRAAQNRARAHARLRRRLVTDADERLAESLAFAGPEH